MINLPMDELVPLIKEVIPNDGEFRLYPRGTSMLPLIVQGEDSVVLVEPSLLSKGDIILYQRKSGQYVLHRIIKIKGENLVICGDNQTELEYGITVNDVIAKVSGVYKGETYFAGNCAGIKFYFAKLWLKRTFKPTCARIKRVIKDPFLVWRKIKGEKR